MSQEKIELLEKNLQRAREDLDDLQRYIDDLTMFLPLAFCTINPLNLVLGANKAFQDLTGYNEIESIGNNMDFLFVEKAKIAKLKEDVIKKESSIIEELHLLTKDRQRIPVMISVLARRDNDNNFLGYFLTITNISENKEFQKKLEQKVKEKIQELEIKNKEIAESSSALLNVLEDTEEEKKRAEEEKNKTMAVIKNFTDGLIIFGKDDKIKIINPKIEKYLKISSSEIINKSLKDLENHEKLKELVKLLRENPVFGGNNLNEQLQKEIENEDKLTLEISAVSISINDDRIGSLVIIHDITREKMIESMKSEFVSIAAHQLRTPLSAIKWTMRMLLDEDLGSLNEEQKGLVEKTYSSNERMIHLINDLLNVTRIEEGRYLYRPELIQIEDIILPLLDSYESEIKRREIKFNIEMPDKKMPKITADGEKLTLVVQNFIENAMKYTNKNGQILFKMFYNPKNKEIQVSVSDTGVGIPKEQQDRLFTKFFRAENVIRMETEGSGLGLFICKNIIEAHKGKVWFESKEGEGSTFHFTLPVKERKEFEDFLKKL